MASSLFKRAGTENLETGTMNRANILGTMLRKNRKKDERIITRNQSLMRVPVPELLTQARSGIYASACPD